MYDFEMSDEQKNLRELVHDFATREVRPIAWDLDRDSGWPGAVIEKAWELGLTNAALPEEYGGSGISNSDAMILGEEMGWGCSGIKTSMFANDLAIPVLVVAGSDEQKRRFLAPLAESPLYASLCLTEPSAGSDFVNIRTVAHRTGSGYVLNGSKVFINPKVAGSNPAPATQKGPQTRAFLVERPGTKGVPWGQFPSATGSDGLSTV